MSAYSKNYFKDGYVEKGDTVYVLSCTTATYQDQRPSTKSYSVQPYTVTSVGRVHLSAKPESGGRSVKFGHLPSIWPSHGMYLVEENPRGAYRDKLFPSRRLAEAYKKILEERDEEQTASGGGGQANAETK